MSKLLLLVSSALIAGCSVATALVPGAEAPKTGARSNGQALWVVDDVKQWTTVQHDHVGEIRVENEAGERLARADVYEDRTHYHAKDVWFPAQGDQVIADEDFFRITGDQAALDATLRYRERNRRWNRAGKISMLAGIGAVLVDSLVHDNTGRALLLLGGFGAIAGGWYVVRWSHDQQEPENHAVDRSTALEAAQRYDRVHGVALLRTF